MKELNEHIEFLEMTESDPQLLVWLLELRRHRDDNWKQRAETLQAQLDELAKQEESRWNTHDGIARPIGVGKDDMVYLRMKRQEIKLPYPAGMVNWKHDGGEFDVIAWASVYSSPRPAPSVSLAELVPEKVSCAGFNPREADEARVLGQC